VKLDKERVEYLQTMSSFELDLMDREQELVETELPEDMTYSEASLGMFDEMSGQIQVPESMDQQFQMDMAKMRLSHGKSAMATQAGMESLKFKTEHLNAMDRENNILSRRGSPEEKQAQLDKDLDRLNNTYAMSKALDEPEQFLKDADAGKYDDIANLNSLRKEATDQIKRDLKKRSQLSELQIRKNEVDLRDEVFNGNMPDKELRIEIQRQLVDGEISSGFATDIKAYIKAREDLVVFEDDAIFDSVLEEIYDVNNDLELSSEDYLVAISNIDKKIMMAVAGKSMSVDTERKIKNQMRQLTGNRRAENTYNLDADVHKKARKIFKDLPPELRGKAARRYFEMTYDTTVNRDPEKRMSFDEQEDYFSVSQDKAHKIMDDLVLEQTRAARGGQQRASNKKRGIPDSPPMAKGTGKYEGFTIIGIE
jgi:hypothetical protein